MNALTEPPGWLTELQTYARWIGDRGFHVEPSSLVAFGIPIESRYGNVCEIHRMLAFTHLAAKCGAASYISNVFYDSKSCNCTITLKCGADRQAEVLCVVEWCAENTLSSFTVTS
jgi:hypothetical protein